MTGALGGRWEIMGGMGTLACAAGLVECAR